MFKFYKQMCETTQHSSPKILPHEIFETVTFL